MNAMNSPARELQRKNAGDHADNQIELKALNDSLAKRDTEIKSWCEKASGEIKSLGKASSETVQALTKPAASAAPAPTLTPPNPLRRHRRTPLPTASPLSRPSVAGACGGGGRNDFAPAYEAAPPAPARPRDATKG